MQVFWTLWVLATIVAGTLWVLNNESPDRSERKAFWYGWSFVVGCGVIVVVLLLWSLRKVFDRGG